MEVLAWFPSPTAPFLVRPWLRHTFKTKRINVSYAKLHIEEEEEEEEEEEGKPFFKDAIHRASIRLRETLRPDPLFIDPYIGCLSPIEIQMDTDDQCLHNHCLATKFIDDKLLSTISETDDLRQVVLLTDGMDTRPYRLKWPASTLIFDVSPETIFRISINKLQDCGAKILRSCLLLHVPSESSDIQQFLHSKGFNGARPSVWALQGFPVTNLADLEDILVLVSNLSAKGCLFFGELPDWFDETETCKPNTRESMQRIFMKHGFRVEIIEYDEISRILGKESATDGYKNIFFVAEQLRFSDDQMFFWRREFERIEEQGDEDGFDEL